MILESSNHYNLGDDSQLARNKNKTSKTKLKINRVTIMGKKRQVVAKIIEFVN